MCGFVFSSPILCFYHFANTFSLFQTKTLKYEYGTIIHIVLLFWILAVDSNRDETGTPAKLIFMKIWEPLLICVTSVSLKGMHDAQPPVKLFYVFPDALRLKERKILLADWVDLMPWGTLWYIFSHSLKKSETFNKKTKLLSSLILSKSGPHFHQWHYSLTLQLQSFISCRNYWLYYTARATANMLPPSKGKQP